MKRKAIEWTIFVIFAAGTVFFVRWFLPWAAFHYYRATHKPAPPRVNLALRQRLRRVEREVSAEYPVPSLGHMGYKPCLVVAAPTGVGPRWSGGSGGPIRDCLELVPGGSPVNAVELYLATGKPVFIQTDMYLPGDPPIAFTRVVQQLWRGIRRYQIFLQNEYGTYPFGDRFPYTYQKLVLADGMPLTFQRVSKGTGYANAVYAHTATPTLFYFAIEGWNGDGWDMDLADGRTLVFPEAYSARRPQQEALTGLIEPSGASLTLRRDRDGNLQSARSSDGRWLKLDYRGPFIVSLKDSAGASASYSYGKGDLLASSKNADGETLAYSYNKQGELTGVRNVTRHRDLLKVVYGKGGRASSLRVAGSPVFHLTYGADPAHCHGEVGVSAGRSDKWTVLIRRYIDSGCTYDVHHR